MKKRYVSLVMCLLMVVCFLTGCTDPVISRSTLDSYGVSDGMNSGSGMDMKSESAVDSFDEADYDDSNYEPAETGSNQQNQNEQESNENQNVKIIRKGDFEIETVNFPGVISAIDAAVDDCEGYFEQRSIYATTSYGDDKNIQHGELVIRIPAKNLDKFLTVFTANDDMLIRRQNVDAEDVSQTYYDIEMRLNSARTKVETLRKLLETAESVSDVITVQNALSDAIYDAEYLQGQINNYDSRINYSYVYVDVSEVTVMNMSMSAVGYGNKLVESFKEGWHSGINALSSFSLSIASNWLSLVIWIVIIWLVIHFTRKYIKKHHVKQVDDKKKRMDALNEIKDMLKDETPEQDSTTNVESVDETTVISTDEET